MPCSKMVGNALGGKESGTGEARLVSESQTHSPEESRTSVEERSSGAALVIGRELPGALLSTEGQAPAIHPLSVEVSRTTSTRNPNHGFEP